MTTLGHVNVLSCRAHANNEKCNQPRISRIARTDLSHETKESRNMTIDYPGRRDKAFLARSYQWNPWIASAV